MAGVGEVRQWISPFGRVRLSALRAPAMFKGGLGANKDSGRDEPSPDLDHT